LNYTYPELAQWSTLSAKEKSLRVHSEVNRLYGRTAPVSAVAPSVFHQPHGTGSDGSHYHEWMANIVVEVRYL